MDITSGNMSVQSVDQIWDIVWKTFKNASLTYDLAFSQNATKTGQSDEGNIFDNPAKLGIFTGLIIAWLADVRIGPIKDSRMLEIKIKTIITWIFNIISFALFSPFIAIFLMLCFLYRRMITLFLEKSEGNDFGGLLEGTDCVWALEDDRAYSVINVLAILEMTNSDPSKILDDLRKLIKDRLISQNFEKLCWSRAEKFGYSYWRRNNGIIDLNERIRWLEDHEDCDGTCGDIYTGNLRTLMNKICNQPLPDDHKTNWEILVGRNYQENPQKTVSIPLIFRIHHSVGDGVALLRVLLEAIADSRFNTDSKINVLIDQTSGRNEEHFDLINGIDYKSLGQVIYYSEDLLDVSMPFAVAVPSIKEKLMKIFVKMQENISLIHEDISRIIKDVGKCLIAMISIPSCLLRQAINSFDSSALHGASLTGEKIISCWMESDFVDDTEDSGLLAKIRDIKNSTGTRFGDVVLACLSSNLHHYFEELDKVAPKSVTVVIPARMSSPSIQLTLRNRFSVGLLPLCISEADGRPLTPIIGENEEDLLERLWDVSKNSENLRQSSDYLINYWIMTWLAAALPKILLAPILKSYSTMIFSNLPGPNEIEILGNCLKKVAFFIPHRGTTGIGLSFLTYGGRAHLSLIVDKGIIKDESILDDIIRGTIDDIQNLHEYIVMKKLAHLRKQGSVCCNE